MSRARALKALLSGDLTRQLRKSYRVLDASGRSAGMKAHAAKYKDITKREKSFPSSSRSTHAEKTSRAIRASIKAEEKYFRPNRRIALGRIPGNRSRSDKAAARFAGFLGNQQRSASPLGRMGQNSRQKLFNRITKRKVRNQQGLRKRRS